MEINYLPLPWVRIFPLGPLFCFADGPGLKCEQLKEKKRQRFLKMTSEGRARARLKRQEENMLQERVQQMDEERRLYVI